MARDRFKNRSASERLGTFGTGKGVYVTDELRDSVAYRVLTPAQRVVLIDMIRQYAAASKGDQEPPDCGFTYCFAHCRELVNHETFRRAVRRICRIGFFRAPHGIQEGKNGTARRFVTSQEWLNYKPTDKERSTTTDRKRRNKERVTRDRRKRTDYHTARSRKRQP